jgi:hypothetical protein
LPSWIEFHDSTLTAITEMADTRELRLEAYVHRWELRGDRWIGTGWLRPVRIWMRNAVGPAAVPVLPASISIGGLRSGEVNPGNLVPLPFESAGEFELSLRLGGGAAVDVAGRELQIEAIGDGRYIEDLPDESKPDAG